MISLSRPLISFLQLSHLWTSIGEEESCWCGLEKTCAGLKERLGKKFFARRQVSNGERLGTFKTKRSGVMVHSTFIMPPCLFSERENWRQYSFPPRRYIGFRIQRNSVLEVNISGKVSNIS